MAAHLLSFRFVIEQFDISSRAALGGQPFESGEATCFYLYVILNVFSRYVVGWMLAPRESAELAEKLIGETCEKQNIQPDTLGLHADRGSVMRFKPVALLLADLSVTKTRGPPYTNDNPYSESQFRTMKCRPEFPDTTTSTITPGSA